MGCYNEFDRIIYIAIVNISLFKILKIHKCEEVFGAGCNLLNVATLSAKTRLRTSILSNRELLHGLKVCKKKSIAEARPPTDTVGCASVEEAFKL